MHNLCAYLFDCFYQFFYRIITLQVIEFFFPEFNVYTDYLIINSNIKYSLLGRTSYVLCNFVSSERLILRCLFYCVFLEIVFLICNCLYCLNSFPFFLKKIKTYTAVLLGEQTKASVNKQELKREQKLRNSALLFQRRVICITRTSSRKALPNRMITASRLRLREW